MKVFDLVCDAGHRFEGWFASAEQFAAQIDASRVECPFCESDRVSRAPSAPRLNLTPADAIASSRSAPAPASSGGDPSPERVAAMVLDRLKRLVAETENVGTRFAEEARRIHYDEAPARAIRGTATDDERRALADEGIETVRLPLPRALTETLQ